MNWNKEDIELVEKFIEIKNKGFYADGGQLTQVYNRVLDKRVNPTNCGSCIRQRINELEAALNQFRRLSENVNSLETQNEASESKTEQEQTPDKVEENASLDAGATNVETKAVSEAGNEDMKARMARVRAAKGKK